MEASTTNRLLISRFKSSSAFGGSFGGEAVVVEIEFVVGNEDDEEDEDEIVLIDVVVVDGGGKVVSIDDDDDDDDDDDEDDIESDGVNVGVEDEEDVVAIVVVDVFEAMAGENGSDVVFGRKSCRLMVGTASSSALANAFASAPAGDGCAPLDSSAWSSCGTSSASCVAVGMDVEASVADATDAAMVEDEGGGSAAGSDCAASDSTAPWQV